MKTFIISICLFLSACGGSSDVGSIDTSADSFSIVFEGDSLTASSSSTWAATVAADSGRVASWNNVAISGTTTVDMANRYGSNVSPHKSILGGVFLINGGTNDIRAGLPNPVSNTYANLQYLWGLARQDGFKVVAFTVHSVYTVTPCATCEADRLALNALIRSDPSLYDALIPMDQIFPDINDATLLYDKVHFTPEGNAKVAMAVEAVLAHL